MDDFMKLASMEYGISPLPENPVPAMAYVPYQQLEAVYGVEQGPVSYTHLGPERIRGGALCIPAYELAALLLGRWSHGRSSDYVSVYEPGCGLENGISNGGNHPVCPGGRFNRDSALMG